jgi:hypothetical protein
MPRMIVKDKALHYGGRSMKAGEQFHASDVDATYFRNRGKAEDAPVEEPKPALRAKPAEAPKPRQPLGLRAAEPAPKVEDEADKKKSTAVAPMSTTTAAAIAPAAGLYGRRDLKAAD